MIYCHLKMFCIIHSKKINHIIILCTTIINVIINYMYFESIEGLTFTTLTMITMIFPLTIIIDNLSLFPKDIKYLCNYNIYKYLNSCYDCYKNIIDLTHKQSTSFVFKGYYIETDINGNNDAIVKKIIQDEEILESFNLIHCSKFAMNDRCLPKEFLYIEEFFFNIMESNDKCELEKVLFQII